MKVAAETRYVADLPGWQVERDFLQRWRERFAFHPAPIASQIPRTILEE